MLDAERIRGLLEARGYEVFKWYDADLGDVLEARVEGRVVARVVRYQDLKEALRALADELGVPVP